MRRLSWIIWYFDKREALGDVPGGEEIGVMLLGDKKPTEAGKCEEWILLVKTNFRLLASRV